MDTLILSTSEFSLSVIVIYDLLASFAGGFIGGLLGEQFEK